MKLRPSQKTLTALTIMIPLLIVSGIIFYCEDVLAVSGEERITVLNPQGQSPLIKRKSMAPRLDNLDGKTVYLVDVRFNDGDVFLQQMESWFKEKMPKVNAVFVRKSGVYTFNDKKLWKEIQDKGDAVIMAIGH